MAPDVEHPCPRCDRYESVCTCPAPDSQIWTFRGVVSTVVLLAAVLLLLAVVS